MSYFLVDNDEYVRDMCTISELKTLRRWSQKLDGPIKDFFTNGTTDDPKRLADALDVQQIDDADIRAFVQELSEDARQASGALTISDGTDDSELASEVEPQSLRSLSLTTAAGYKTRTETFEGREHLVVPVVALMQGVVHAMNAENPEFVPGEELRARGWNGRPVYLNHPLDGDGNPVSGGSAKILEASRIGVVQGTRVSKGKLLMEAWLDVERCQKIAPTLLERVRKDSPIEISVGVFTDTDNTEGEYQGKRYAGVWRGLVPDHLAILDEEHTGACSREMGCGVRAAQEKPMDSMYLEWLEAADDNAEFLRACRNIPQSERDKMPAEDFAGPNRSFPIQEAADVSAAAHALGRAKGNRDAIKRKIIAIAYRKGFDASLPDDWKKKSDMKGASIFARIMEAFRTTQPANKMGANDLQKKVMEAVQEMEPGSYCSYVDMFPVTDPAHVVYQCWTQEVNMGYTTPCLSERSFTLDADGVVTVSDTKIEVEAVVNYEPVEGAQPMAASAAEAKPCSCKDKVAAATEQASQGDTNMADQKEATPAAAAAAPEAPKALSTQEIQTMISEGVAAGIKALTFDQVLEKADPGMRDAINSGKALGEKKKADTIAALKATNRCKYTDAELGAMTQGQLDNLVELAGSNVRAAIDFTAQGAPRPADTPQAVEKVTFASQNEALGTKFKK